MLPEARRRAIQADLERSGSGTIAELSRRYHVSAMTIRRDLKILERRGILSMTHGGAVINSDIFSHALPDHVGGGTHRRAAENAIGEYAARRFVSDGDTLFIDASETTGALLPFLSEKAGLTIASNGLRMLERLRQDLQAGEVYGTGGLLVPGERAFSGSLAEGFFQGFFARTAFISGCGFTLGTGLTSSALPQATLKRAMIASAERCIVLMPSSKLGMRAKAQILPSAVITTMITDAGISEAMRRDIGEAGIDLHIAEA